MGGKGERQKKNLWAPWRMEYIKQGRRQACVFCDALREGKEREGLVVWRGEAVFAMLNRFPYAHGHLLISPCRHAKDLEGLTLLESQALMHATRDAVRVLTRCLAPEGFNVGINLGKVAGAGFADHLHLHIVPRWNGDHNFMPVLGDTWIISEHLENTYNKLREGFQLLATESSA
jgi:ATP adenylyltransferase